MKVDLDDLELRLTGGKMGKTSPLEILSLIDEARKSRKLAEEVMKAKVTELKTGHIRLTLPSEVWELAKTILADQ
jgi:hypothetical protein